MIPRDVLENFPTSHPKKSGWPALRVCGGRRRRVSQIKGSGSKHRTYGDHGLLHPPHRRIDVRDVPPAPYVSELLDCVQLLVLVPWVIDQRDALGGWELRRAELLIELSWSTSPRVRPFVLVLVLVRERAVGERGDTEGDGEDVVYFLHELFLLLAEGVEQCRVGRFVGQRQNLG